MLVLQRKPGEAIILNRRIKIWVFEVANGRVKLGVDAPPDVVIIRSELLDNPEYDATHPGPYRSERTRNA